jgi:hypothetical protein
VCDPCQRNQTCGICGAVKGKDGLFVCGLCEGPVLTIIRHAQNLESATGQIGRKLKLFRLTNWGRPNTAGQAPKILASHGPTKERRGTTWS